MVGTERTLKSGERWRFYQTANLGYFQHHWWISGVTLDTELGIGRRLPLGLHSDLRLGLGYLHYFWRREGMTIRDGRYEPAADWGRPALIVPFSAVLGYRGSSHRPAAVSPFVAARWVPTATFLEDEPVISNLLLLGGLRLEWGGGR
jgi:hypothetical protein